MFVIKLKRIILKNCDIAKLIYSNVQQNICTTSRVQVKYYETLGLTSNATQNEIKVAYYKLSMLYHPDKNKGSEVAAEKFRDITTAYEVLGNFRLRKLYDKGIIHTAGAGYTNQMNAEDIENPDDAQTKFYKAHEHKSKVPNATGRTPIYNFDEWSRSHYNASFERKKVAKERFDAQEKRKLLLSLSSQNEIFLFGLIFVICLFLIMTAHEVTYDSDKTETEEKKT